MIEFMIGFWLTLFVSSFCMILYFAYKDEKQRQKDDKVIAEYERYFS